MIIQRAESLSGPILIFSSSLFLSRVEAEYILLHDCGTICLAQRDHVI